MPTRPVCTSLPSEWRQEPQNKQRRGWGNEPPSLRDSSLVPWPQGFTASHLSPTAPELEGASWPGLTDTYSLWKLPACPQC